MPLTINLEENALFKRGVKKAYRTVVIEMLKNNVTVEEISKYTGIDIEYILEIEKGIKK